MSENGTNSEARVWTRGTALAVSCIALAAIAVRLPHAGDPIGGFHAFNEAWYAEIAKNYHSLGSLLYPTLEGKVDYNVPPLFSWLLFAVTRIFGFRELAMRLVPILFCAATAPLLYALGARFFNRRAGLAAAALYEFAPVSIIIGRNIQTDAVYLFLMLASMLIYMRARDAGGKGLRLMAAAGLIFGAAFMTKQFAVLILPAVFVWETVRARGLKWIGLGHVVFGIAAALPAAPFYIYHLLINTSRIAGTQEYIRGPQTGTVTLYTLKYILSEYWWGLSPVVAVLCVAGLVRLLARRSAGGWFVISAVVTFNLFFLKWNGHSYYLLFCVPFLCLAAGALLGAVRRRAVAAVVVAASVAVSAALAVGMLCTVKYGRAEARDFDALMSKQSLRPVMLIENDLYGSYHPVFFYYGRGLDIREEGAVAKQGRGAVLFPPDRIVFYLAGDNEALARCPHTPYQPRFIDNENYELVLFGRAVTVRMISEHFFKVEGFTFEKAGGPFEFGIRDTGPSPSLVYCWATPGRPVPFRNGKVDFRH